MVCKVLSKVAFFMEYCFYNFLCANNCSANHIFVFFLVAKFFVSQYKHFKKTFQALKFGLFQITIHELMLKARLIIRIFVFYQMYILQNLVYVSSVGSVIMLMYRVNS